MVWCADASIEHRAGMRSRAISTRSQPAESSLDSIPAFNIAPTTTQPVIRQSRDTAQRELVPDALGFGRLPEQRPDPKRSTFNARCESLESSRHWRGPLSCCDESLEGLGSRMQLLAPRWDQLGNTVDPENLPRRLFRSSIRSRACLFHSLTRRAFELTACAGTLRGMV